MAQSVYHVGAEEFVDSDYQLLEKVANRLADNNFPSLKSLEITVDKGRLTLSGNVRTFHEKQIAICLSRRVDGVFGLVDQIEVIN